MATQLVPVMRVKVDPNPRGSATSHVTMPAANPFERETLSVRTANQPPQLSGLGDVFDPTAEFSFDYGQSPQQNDFLFNDPALMRSPEDTPEPAEPSWLGKLLQGLTGSAIKVAETAAITKMKSKQDKSIQTNPTQQLLMAYAMKKMGQPQMSQMYAVNPNMMYPPPKPSSRLPIVVGGLAVVGIVGYMMLNKGGSGGKTRRRRRRRRR